MVAGTSNRPLVLSVGTLSFARCGNDMMLSPAERNRLIVAAYSAYAPDLLVTAGYAVHSRSYLHGLAVDIADEGLSGTVITEVHYDGRAARDEGRLHAMWAITSDGGTHRFGRQAFATSAEVRAADAIKLARFIRHLPRRRFATHSVTVFALCCGEINIVHGRNAPRFVNDDAGDAIMAADIVINPTHDRMSHAGTLDAKRRFLSRRGADDNVRAYISVSNWEACGLNGRVQRPSPTLHTVYVDGEPIAYDEQADGAFGFVYRGWRLRL